MAHKHLSPVVVALIVFLGFVSFLPSSTAQIIQLGSGTDVTGNSSASPINIYYRSLRYQVVYTASELHANGIYGGYLSKLGFYIESVPTYSLPNYSIKMKHTTASDASIHDGGPFTEVYFNPAYVPTAGGFDILEFSGLFFWNGSDNILFDICFDRVPDWTSTGTVRYYYVNDAVRYDRSDSEDMCNQPTTSVISQKPQVQMEFISLADNDAGITAVLPDFFCAGSHDIVATVSNFGSNQINPVTVNWEFDGFPETPVSYNSIIDTIGSSNNSAMVLLGNKNFLDGQEYTIKVWTSDPNAVADTTNINDTLMVTVSPSLSGTFTIGGATPDYANFTMAVNALANYGVCGPVVFDVRNGIYNEQVSIPQLQGSSSINTVIFQSESGDSSQVILIYGSSGYDMNYTLQLDNADNITIKDMTLKATADNTGVVVDIRNNSHHNIFMNNVFEGFPTSVTWEEMSLVYSFDNSVDSLNTFTNNHFINGSWGVYFQHSDYAYGNIFSNNYFDHQTAGGLYLYNEESPQIRDNLIEGNFTITYFYGIQSNSSYNDFQITGNIFRIPNSGTAIYLNGSYAVNGNTAGLVANNFMTVEGASLARGIYSRYGYYTKIYYNSVLVNSTDINNSWAFYADYGDDQKVLNNIFSNLGGGLAYFTNSNSNIIISDNNDLYSTGEMMGIYNNNYADNLEEWINFSGLDSNSVSANPSFFSPTDLHTQLVDLNGHAFPVPEITVDIDGDARNATMPDIGADEFDPPPLDAGTAGFSSPQVPFSSGNQPVKTVFKNFGSTILTSAQIDWTFNGAAQTAVNWNGTLPGGDTVHVELGIKNFALDTPYSFEAWASLPNGSPDPYPANDTSFADNIYAALDGTYTIGVSGDFSTFGAAVNVLEERGILGPVVFNVQPGSYIEPVVISDIPGCSCANTITFQSLTGDSTSVTLNHNASYNENYTVLLDGAKGIIFKDMTLGATNFSYSRVVELRNGAECNQFSNNILQSVITTSTSFSRAIVYSGSVSTKNYNQFINNRFLNGSFGLYFENLFDDPASGTIIDNNDFLYQHGYGIYLWNHSAPQVRGNTIISGSNTFSYGIYIEEGDSSITVSKNNIIIDGDGVGIYINSENSDASNRGLIANNFIKIGKTNIYSSHGIYFTYTNYFDVYFNSINLTSPEIGNSSPVEIYYSGNLNFANNILANTGGGFCVFVSGPLNFSTSDFNDFYFTGNNLGYLDGDLYPDLASWQLATGSDSNSVTINPFFFSETDLHTGNINLKGTGTPIPGIPDDIDGDLRNPVTPDIGADEFVTSPNDVAMKSFDTPSPPFPSGVQDIKISFLNNGSNSLSNIEFNWSVNDSIQAPFNWAGLLFSGDQIDSLVIGSVDFELGLPYQIVIWSTNPNGNPDANMLNDTLVPPALFAGLGGDYTIGGVDPDFETFSDVMPALNFGGVYDSVSIQVRNGTYDEQIRFGEYPGASPDRPVVFQSESGNNMDVTLSYNANSANNYTVKLDSADYITFKEMTLKAENSVYGIVAYLTNGATNIEFLENILQGYNTTSTSISHSIIYSPSTSLKNENLTVNGNLFINGSYGLRIQGSNIPGLTINNNTFSQQYRAGIVALGYSGAEVINNQFINNSYQNYYGMDIENSFSGLTVSNNRIEVGVGGFGIFFYNNSGSSSDRNLVSNNMIYVGPGGNNTHGFNAQYTDYLDLYYNTIHSAHLGTSSAAFELGYGSNFTLVNNIIVHSGNSYAIYSNTGTNIDSSDYNDLYTASGNLAYLGGTDITDLAGWQATTGFDNNSISVDPQFVTATDLHVREITLDGAATPIASITLDIDGEMRDAVEPDIGADEFTPPSPDDSGISAFLNPRVPFAEGVNNVEVAIKNFGSDPLTSATIHWTVNNVAQSTFTWTGSLPPGEQDTVTVGSYDFIPITGYDLVFWTTDPNGIIDTLNYNDTTMVFDLYPALSGEYTIGGPSPDFPDFITPVTVLKYGGVLGDVTLKVRPGTYNEQLVIKNIPGATDTSRVRFQAENGDSSTVLLSYHNTSELNYVVRLENAEFVTFRNMSFGSTNTFYSHLIELTGGASKNEFMNNAFVGLDYPSTSPSSAIIYSYSGELNQDNIFRSNRFQNGSYAFYYLGNNVGDLAQGLVIENNVFDAQYYRGVQLYYQNAPQISDNIFTGSLTYNFYTGLSLQYCDNGLRILRNSITAPVASEGISLYRCDGTISNRGLIANNFVYVGGTQYSKGISVNYSNFLNFYHNNIHNISNFPTARALNLEYGSNLYLRNNIFANGGGGYAVYANSIGSISISDYNDFYTTGPVLAFLLGERTDLAAWQLASGKDANSFEVNPLFYSPTDLHISQAILDSAAFVIPEITDDFDGQPRDLTFPDIGADEFDYFTDDVGVVAFIAPVSGCDLGESDTVKVSIQNYGGVPKTGFDVAYIFENGVPVVENTGSLVVPPGGTAVYAFSSTIDISAFGDYSINAYTLLPGDENPSNDILAGTIFTNHEGITEGVSNMLPSDGTVDLDLPIEFSWAPPEGATHFDLYLWLAGDTEPTIPEVANITQISYLYSGSLIYGSTYHWRLVSRNSCSEFSGPMQSFTLRDLPDLAVDNVMGPANAFSGQTISVSWNVNNQGTGGTGMQSWFDVVYLSADQILNIGTDLFMGTATNLSALNAGEGYAQSKQINLPQGIAGNYYVFVVTDRYLNILEGDENNNSAIITVPIVISLTPPPDLQVTSILPPNNAFSGQEISVSWTVSNLGSGSTVEGFWRDRVYLSPDTIFNAGNATYLGQFDHIGTLDVNNDYTQNQMFILPQNIFGDYYIWVLTDYQNHVFEFASEGNNTSHSSAINVILTPPPDLVVTTVDAPPAVSNNETVTVSWTVQNQGGTAPLINNWYDRIYMSSLDTFNVDSAIFLVNYYHIGNLGVGETYDGLRNIIIPVDIGGPHFIYVKTDVFNYVDEFSNENNNTTRSAGMTVLNPDLEATDISNPATGNSGELIPVSWTSINNGPGSLLNRSWKDSVFISHHNVYHPDSVTLLGMVSMSNYSMNPGDTIHRQLQGNLPNGISGLHYIYIFTDKEELIVESDETNNIALSAIPIDITLSPWPDLEPTSLIGPSSTIAGSEISINYSVVNNGVASLSGNSWKDKVYLSADPDSLNYNYAIFLREFIRSDDLNTNDFYSVSTSATLPVNLVTGDYYLYVHADQENQVYEHVDEDNNLLRSDSIHIEGYPPVDIAVTFATGPATASSGQTISIQWTVENIGQVPTLASNWFDALYLSADGDWSLDDIFVEEWQISGPLSPGSSYADSRNVILPNGVSGDFYLLIVADHTEQNVDSNPSNNYLAVNSGNVTTIDLTPPPDLVITSFNVPNTAVSGQPLQVSWTVMNAGPGPTVPGNWTERFYLSTDFSIDNNDPILGTRPHNGTLNSLESFTDTFELNIPISAVGNFIIIMKTDNNNVVYEHGMESNNTATALVNVFQPPPCDLVVSTITVPASAIAGDPITIEWELLNNGQNPANGSMKETVYLSSNLTWDISDPLLGIKTNYLNLPPQGLLQQSLTAELTGVALGNYYVIVRTDILNNIYESEEGNNTTVSATPVNVDVNELELNVLTANNLENEKALYYRIEIADSLIGESLLVSLKGDSVSGANELYLRFADIPTRVVHDYAFDVPFYGNQEIIVPSLDQGTYYLLAYGSTSAGLDQNITLLATILDFEIRNIHSNQGGNTGPVTVQVKGAKFDPNMVLQMYNTTGDTLTGFNLVYMDPTRIYVTFDLTGAAIGMYDVWAQNSNLETDLVPDGFEVIAGGPASLAINVVHPSSTRPFRIITLDVQYANDGDVDIIDPVVLITSMAGAPISFTLGGLDQGLTQLTIPLQELNGPPGVLRPDATGVMTVYAKSTTALGFTLLMPNLN